MGKGNLRIRLLLFLSDRRNNKESLQQCTFWGHAAHKMELFVTIVNNWKPLTIVTKNSIFGSLTLPLPSVSYKSFPQVALVYLFIYPAYTFLFM